MMQSRSLVPLLIASSLLLVAYIAPKSSVYENSVNAKFDTNYDCINTSFPVLNGIDLVEIQSLSFGSPAVYGSSDYTAKYRGYTFYFSSFDNKEAFESDPSVYLPRWGGFCAYGISEEDSWSVDLIGPATDVDVWEIYEGNLYFFRGASSRVLFNESIDAAIIIGNKKWKDWFGDYSYPYNTQCFMEDSTEVVL